MKLDRQPSERALACLLRKSICKTQRVKSSNLRISISEADNCIQWLFEHRSGPSCWSDGRYNRRLSCANDAQHDEISQRNLEFSLPVCENLSFRKTPVFRNQGDMVITSCIYNNDKSGVENELENGLYDGHEYSLLKVEIVKSIFSPKILIWHFERFWQWVCETRDAA